MQLTDLGPRVYRQGVGVASLTYTPPADRAAAVTRINIGAVSAADSWQVIVGGRELARFYVPTTGSQSLLAYQGTFSPTPHDIFRYCRNVLGVPLEYPVPNGLTLTVQSVGGATATITINARECSPSDVNAGQLNHYLGGHFLLPTTFYRAAAVAAAGHAAFDTTVKPPWVPDPVTGVAFPTGFRARLLALFTEGGGVNTFSGAANHVSSTTDLSATRDGQILFTRDGLGIPLLGGVAAAGSANTVRTTIISDKPSFGYQNNDERNLLDPPLTLSGGDLLQWQLGVTGDVTGGADYSSFAQVMLVDLQQGG